MSSPVQPPLRVETVDGTTSGRPITTIKVTNGDLSISGSVATIDTSGAGGGGTVTSVGTSQAFITITNPTTTPSISIGNASGAATGVLTAANFNTFDAKQDAITLTTTGSTGVATFSADTLNIPNYTTPQASYLTLGTDAGLTNERVLTAGTGISFTDTGAGGTLTIEATGGGGSVTSVALTESGNALTVTGSPITGSGTFNIAGAGDSSQVILGDLTLGTLTSGTVTSVTGTAPIVSSGGTTPVISLANTAVTPGSYTTADITVDAQGRITAAANGSGGGGGTIGGSITDNKVAVGASTADDIEGYSDFTYNDSTDTLTVGEKVDSSGTSPLLLQAGSSVISVLDGGVANHINISPASGRINAQSSTLSVGTNATDTVISSSGAYNLTLNTNDGTNSGSIVIEDGVNGQISITPDGTGLVKIDGVGINNSAIATGYILKATSTTEAGWVAESGGGTPAGSTGQIQYNDGGAFGALPSTVMSFDGTDLTKLTIGDVSDASSNELNINVSNIGWFGVPGGSNWNCFGAGGGQIKGFPQSASAPFYAFNPPGNSGMFASGSNGVGFSVDGTERLRIHDDGEIGLSGANYGTSGQVLTSGGSGAAASWTTVSGSPAGSNKELQFNDSGSFGASDRCQLEIFSPSGNAGFGLNLNGAAFTSNGFLIYAQGNVFFQSQVFGNEFLCGSSSSTDVGFGPQSDQNTGIAFSAADQVDIVTGGGYNISFGSSKEILLEGTNAGTSGQVLTSNGAGAKVDWTNPKALSGTPASSSASGSAGDLQFDSNYLYVCTAVNTWKRVGLSSW